MNRRIHLRYIQFVFPACGPKYSYLAQNLSVPNHVHIEDTLHMPSSPPAPESPTERNERPVTNGSQRSPDRPSDKSHDNNERPQQIAQDPSADTSVRLEAMQQERDSLRDEVTKLRQSLESLQLKHTEELSSVKEELEQSQQNKEQAESQYQNLLGRVNTIRSQLGERLKADREELEQSRGRIEELEGVNNTMREENEWLQGQMMTLKGRLEQQTTEIESLRSRTNLSTSNWAKERDELASREAYIREEYDVAKQAMQDWEILATEERSRREALEERVNDLEDQLGGSREAYERAKSDAEMQSNTVDGLQRALRDIQEERKRELRDLVEQSQAQLDELRAQAKQAEDSVADLKEQLNETKKELERALPFEREVKEKNLLIGKLRHEAVILNDHLTKALRFLKRGRPEDNVDRQLVTNHLLHFLALDRSDPKKFQILQLIAALLGWDEHQREQAGLLRAGSNTGSLKLPMSPYRRTPSTPSLSTDFMPESPAGAAGRESLAELWSEFLEREAEAGSNSSRRGSLKTVRSPSVTSTTAAGRISPEIRKTESASIRSGGGSGTI